MKPCELICFASSNWWTLHVVRFGSRSFPGWTTADYFTFPSLFHLIFFQHAHGKQRVGQKTLQYAQALLIYIQEFYSTSQSAISSQLVSATILLVSSAPVLCRILYQCLPQSSTATLYISHPSGDVMWGLYVLDLIVFCTLFIAAFPYHLLAFSGPFLVKLCLSIWQSVASTKLGFLSTEYHTGPQQTPSNLSSCKYWLFFPLPSNLTSSPQPSVGWLCSFILQPSFFTSSHLSIFSSARLHVCTSARLHADNTAESPPHPAISWPCP